VTFQVKSESISVRMNVGGHHMFTLIVP